MCLAVLLRLEGECPETHAPLKVSGIIALEKVTWQVVSDVVQSGRVYFGFTSTLSAHFHWEVVAQQDRAADS